MTNVLERRPLSNSSPAAQKTNKLGPLTSIRFVAALWVVIYHTFPVGESSTNALHGLFRLGFTAVGFFFVLSGFILATVYQRLGDRHSIRRFWAARFARIYPVYLFSLLADVPRLLSWRVAKYGLVSGAAATFGALGIQATMIQTWLPLPMLQGLNSPSWSVSTEVFFYLAFPFLVGPMSAIRSVIGLLGVLAGAWGLAMLAPALVCACVELLPSNIEGAIGESPILRLPEFIAGVALANLHRAWQRSEREWKRIANVGLALSSAILAPLALFAYEACYLALHNGLLMPVYCCLILSAALCGGGLRTVLSLPAFVLLGEASYAVYLVHAPLRTALQSVGLAENIYGWSAYMAILIGASLLVYSFLERPLRIRIMALYDNWAVSFHEGARVRALRRSAAE